MSSCGVPQAKPLAGMCVWLNLVWSQSRIGLWCLRLAVERRLVTLWRYGPLLVASGMLALVTVLQAPPAESQTAGNNGTYIWFSEGDFTTRQVAAYSPRGTTIGAPLRVENPLQHEYQFSLLSVGGDTTFGISESGQLVIEDVRWNTLSPTETVVAHVKGPNGRSLVNGGDRLEDTIVVRIEFTGMPNNLPHTPTQLRLVADRGHSVDLSWLYPGNVGQQGLTCYEVYYRERPKGFSKVIPALFPGWYPVVLRSQAWPHTTEIGSYSCSEVVSRRGQTVALDPSKDYDFRVRGRNPSGVGAWSSVLAVKGRDWVPVFLGEPASYGRRWLLENTPPGQPVGRPFVATSPRGHVPSYHLEGELSQFFAINTGGQILTVDSVQYDYESEQRFFQGLVVATAGGFFAKYLISVTVVNVRKEVPLLGPSEVRIVDFLYPSVTLEWPEVQSAPPVTHYAVTLCQQNRQFGSSGTVRRCTNFATRKFAVESDEYTRVGNGGKIIRYVFSYSGTRAHRYSPELDDFYFATVAAVNRHGEGPKSHSDLVLHKQPATFVEGTSTTRQIPENATPGMFVGSPVQDSLGSVSTNRYTIESFDQKFTIDAVSGQIRVNAGAQFDFETQQSHTVRVFTKFSEEDACPWRFHSWCAIRVDINVVDVDEPPLSPTAVSLGWGGVDALELRWTAPQNDGRPSVTGYNYQRYNSTNGNTVTVIPIRQGGDAATFGGLMPGQRYWFRVQAVNDEGTGAWSDWAEGRVLILRNSGRSIWTPAFARSIAENTVSRTAVGSALASFGPTSGSVEYELVYSRSPGESSTGPPFTFDEGTGQVYTISGENYDHEVTPLYVVELHGNYSPSSANGYWVHLLTVKISVTDVSEPPSAPSGLVMTEPSTDTLKISWRVPEGNGRPPISHYEFRQREVSPTVPVTVNPVAIGTDWARIANLESGTWYEVSLRAVNDEGSSAWSPWVRGRTLRISDVVVAFNEASPIQRQVSERVTGSTFPVGEPISITGLAGRSTVFRLGGDAATYFSIDTSGQIYSRPDGVSYDYESRKTVSGTVTVTVGSISKTAVLTISITDESEPALPLQGWVESRVGDQVEVRWRSTPQPGRPPVTGYEFRYSYDWYAGTMKYITPTRITGNVATFSGMDGLTRIYFAMRAINVDGGQWTDFTTEPVDVPRYVPGRELVLTIPEDAVGRQPIGEPLAEILTVAKPTISSREPNFFFAGVLGEMVSMFSVDARTGQITSISGEFHDYETKPIYYGRVPIRYSFRPLDSQYYELPIRVQLLDVEEPPVPPATLWVEEAQAESLTVGWAEGDNVRRPAVTHHDFEIRVRGQTEFQRVIPTTKGDGTATLSNLVPQRHYEFRIRSINHEGTSSWSNVATGETLPPPPPVVQSGNPSSSTAPISDVSSRDGFVRSVPENTSLAWLAGTAFRQTLRALRDYQMVPGEHDFAISPLWGFVYVKSNAMLDFEAQNRYEMTVTAANSGGVRLEIPLVVHITDVVEPPLAPANVAATVTSSVVNISWDPPDSTGRPEVTHYELSYRPLGLPSASWSTTVTYSPYENMPIDRLWFPRSHEVKVRAFNDEGTGTWSEVLQIETNLPPKFWAGDTAVRLIDERSPAGSAVGTALQATDLNGHAVTFSLPTYIGRDFAISSSGQVQVTEHATLDFEAYGTLPPVETIVVRATDELGAFTDLTLTIHVRDIFEPPLQMRNVTIVSHTPTSVTITAEDGNASGRPPILGVVIDSNDPEGLRFRQKFVRPTAPSATSGPKQYFFDHHEASRQNVDANGGRRLAVWAWNAEGKGPKVNLVVPVASTPANRAPRFTGGNWRTLRVKAIDGRSLASRVQGILPIGDPLQVDDPEGDDFAFSVHGRLADVLHVDRNGQMQIEYERWLASEFGATWRRNLGTGRSLRSASAASGGYPILPAPQVFAVTVRATDTNNNASEYQVTLETQLVSTPVAEETAEVQEFTYQVAENSPAGTLVGSPLRSAVANAVTFALASPSGAGWAMDAQTGQLRVAAGGEPDFEVQETFTLDVTATISGEDPAEILIHIQVVDVNEPPLQVMAPVVTGVGTNGIAVEWIAPDIVGRPTEMAYELEYREAEASDPLAVGVQDADDTRTTLSNLTPDTTYQFRVRAINAEGAGPWSEEVTGTTLLADGGIVISSSSALSGAASDGTSAHQNVLPEFSESPVWREIEHDAVTGTAVGEPIVASDRDATDVLSYRLDDSHDAGLFELDAASGQLRVAAPGLDPNSTATAHVVIVGVTDGRDLLGMPDPAIDASVRVEIQVRRPPTREANYIAGSAAGQLGGQVMRELGMLVSERIQQPELDSGLWVGGRNVGWESDDQHDGELAHFAVRSPFDDVSAVDTWGGDAAELWYDSRFETEVNPLGVRTSTAPQWRIWGGGSTLVGDSEPDAVFSWTNGEVGLSHTGVEMRITGQGLSGLVFGQSVGDVVLEQGTERTVFAWRSHSVHSYAKWLPNASGAVWGSGGVQRGRLRGTELATSGHAESYTFLIGGEYRFLDSERAKFTVHAQSRTLRTRWLTEGDADEHMAATDVERVYQLGLSASRQFNYLDVPWTLYGHVNLRDERKPAESDRGTKAVVGLGWADLPRGWKIDAHAGFHKPPYGDGVEGAVYELELVREADGDGRGFAANLTKRWGQQANAEAPTVWWSKDDNQTDSYTTATADLVGRMSFGVRTAGGQQVLTPYGEFSGGGGWERKLKLGVSLDRGPQNGFWSVDVYAEREETGISVDRKIGLDASIQF